MSYDVNCWDLAEKFLTDYFVMDITRKAVTDRLAQVIQTAIEDELKTMEDEKLIREKA